MIGFALGVVVGVVAHVALLGVWNAYILPIIKKDTP